MSDPGDSILIGGLMVLNYLEDEVAIEGVIYIYKGKNGATQARRFFDIPSMREKLIVLQ